MPGPAATISHMHTCPMYSGTSPHTGGPIIGPGVPTVLIGGKPAAVMGDQCTCSGPPDVIVEGVSTVLIGGRPAATMGSKTGHGGVVSIGDPTVLIGTRCSAPTAIMPVSKIPFPKISFKDRILTSLSGNSLAEAEANQAALREEEEGEPRVYNLRWIKEERLTKKSSVLTQVTLKASVVNFDDGESVTFTINLPTKEKGGDTEQVTLTGTVRDKEVQVVWETKDKPEQTL